MGTFESLRRVYGAIKDSTTVGLAKVNSDFKDLDIAIVKATNHEECPPNELHVRRMFSATCVAVPRADVAYCIHALSRRLMKTRNWIVAVKTLIVFHRILREGDPSFREELLNYSYRRHIFEIPNFLDNSSPLAWDCSSWVRTYALFLEERLECYRVLCFDIEAERLTKSAPGIGKLYSRTRLMNIGELLEQLPAIQQLLYRLVACQPEGAAFHNCLIQHALALVVKESFKVYCAINDGIINLVDMFFNMSKHDAAKALNIYRKAGQQTESLAQFYNLVRHLRLAKNFQFPTLRQPPPSFLATMEEHIQEGPSKGSTSNKKLDVFEEHSPRKTNESANQEIEEVVNEEALQKKEAKRHDHPPPHEPQPRPEPKVEEEVPPLEAPDANDLLGLNEINPKSTGPDESNSSALATVQLGAMSSGWNEIEKASGWELALITAPSNMNNKNTTSQDKLGGGFNKLLLDSLYEEDLTRKQTLQLQPAGYEYGIQHNPFDPRQTPQQQDPFVMSNGVPPSTNVQMAMMQQQQQQYMMNQQQYQQHYLNQYQQQQQQQQNMFVPYMNQPLSNQYAPQQLMWNPNPNPFGDAMISYPQRNPGFI